MTIVHLPPVDSTAQSPSPSGSASSARDWQRFESMLKTEMDNQTAASANAAGTGHGSSASTPQETPHRRQNAAAAVQSSTSVKNAKGTDPKAVQTNAASQAASSTQAPAKTSSASQAAVTSSPSQAASDDSGSTDDTGNAAAPMASAGSQDLTDQTPAAVIANALASVGSATATAASQPLKRGTALTAKASDGSDVAPSLTPLGLPLIPSLEALPHTASVATAASSGAASAMATDGAAVAASLAGLGLTSNAAITGAVSGGSAAQPQASEASAGQTDQSSDGDTEQSDPQQPETAANLAKNPVQNGQSGIAQTAQLQQSLAPLLNQLQAAIIVAPHGAAGSVPAAPQASAPANDRASSDIDAGAEIGAAGLEASGQSLTAVETTATAQTANAGSATYAANQMVDPAQQVALAIGRLTNGARSFSMQLNPEQLGSVSVRMDVDAKGKTKVAITAERPETLALLKQDSHHLIKALQESGLSNDQPVVLNFSLRDQGSGAAQDRRSGSDKTAANNSVVPDETDLTEDATPVRTSLSRHLYDIHA